MRNPGVIFLLPLLLVWLVACGPSDPGATDAGAPADPAAEDAPEASVTETTRGPVTVRVEVNPAAPSLSDLIRITVTTRVEEGAEAERPVARAALAEFVMRDFRHEVPEAEGDVEVLRSHFEVEAEHTGKHLIRPFTVKFRVTKPGEEGEPGKDYEVATDPLEIDVSSMLGEAQPDLADLRGPRGLVDLPAPPTRVPWIWLGAGAGALLAAAVAWVLLRRRRGPAPERRLTPEEQAYLELQSLVDADLAGLGRYSEFYVELTGIVRRYIERTTDVHAPEQTTEEFLREAHGRNLFEPAKERELAAFLEAADLVKFAAQVPGAAQIEESFNTAKAFVGLAGPRRDGGAA